MQLAVGIGNAIAVAQRVERIALAWVQFAGQCQRVEHAAVLAERPLAHSGEFGIQEADVEGGVVDDDLGLPDE